MPTSRRHTSHFDAEGGIIGFTIQAPFEVAAQRESRVSDRLAASWFRTRGGRFPSLPFRRRFGSTTAAGCTRQQAKTKPPVPVHGRGL